MTKFHAVISKLWKFLHRLCSIVHIALKLLLDENAHISKFLEKKISPLYIFNLWYNNLFIFTKISADRQWRKNDPSREVLEQLVRSTGLWERCTFQATGHYQCDYYDNFFIGKFLLYKILWSQKQAFAILEAYKAFEKLTKNWTQKYFVQ